MNAATEFPYRIVDVFTREQLEGNALAVFLNGTGLSDAQMQRIARELNLSETVFLMPATRTDCVAKLRIFTPSREMIFAGHPTIGTSFVLLDEGRIPSESTSFAVEVKVGAVPIRIESGPRPLIWLTTPPIQDGPVFDRELCAEVLQLTVDDMLECQPQLLSAGNPSLFVALKDKTTVDRASASTEGFAKVKEIYPAPSCLFIFTPVPEGAYSRMFAPEYGIIEDPATGSATGPLAAYMMRHQLVKTAAGTRFISEQGTHMGRRSFLHVHLRGEHGSEGIDVGGYVTSLARGVLHLNPATP